MLVHRGRAAMGQRTAAEAKASNEKLMGKDLGEQFSELWQHAVQLHLTWGEYRELFSKDRGNTKTINQAAGNFFWIVQDALWDGTLLQITRLTDPPAIGKKRNLSVQNLVELVDGKYKSAVEDAANTAVAKSDFCRDWRNRRIAHHDLDLALKRPDAEDLDVATLEKVSAAIDAIANVLNIVQKSYKDGETFFKFAETASGAKALISVIADGLKFRERERAEMKAVRWPG